MGMGVLLLSHVLRISERKGNDAARFVFGRIEINV